MGIFSMLLHLVFMILGVEPSNKFPPALSKEEENECFAKKKKGDLEARNRLIEHNLRLVAHIVRKYYTSYKEPDELISVGTIGLIKAVDSFDDQNGARFATYAAKCIQNEILMLFRSQKKTSQEVSLNEVIDIDKDGNQLTYIDIICTDDTIADDVDRKIKIEKTMYYVKNYLSAREREIMAMRYGLYGKEEYTQREVAQKLNISRSYVSRIEKSCLEKINNYLTGGS